MMCNMNIVIYSAIFALCQFNLLAFAVLNLCIFFVHFVHYVYYMSHCVYIYDSRCPYFVH